MRILALDYGERRIGVAVSDELGITAQGLTTLIRKNLKWDMGEITKVVEAYSVDRVVVGYPVRLDGTRGIQCEKVDRFIGVLEKTLTVPVERWDEGLSTWEAEEVLTEALVKGRKRKAVVDKIAACVILRDYLSCLRRQNMMNEEVEDPSWK